MYINLRIFVMEHSLLQFEVANANYIFKLSHVIFYWTVKKMPTKESISVTRGVLLGWEI